MLARLLGPKLAERWKVSVVTENRVGESGAIGTEFAAKAAPNGLTVLFTATAHGTVPALDRKLAYAPLQSFDPVVLLGTSALGVLISGKSPMTNFKDFVVASKLNPGQLN